MSFRKIIVFALIASAVLAKDTEEDTSEKDATTCEDWKASTVGEKGYQTDDDGKTFRNAEG